MRSVKAARRCGKEARRLSAAAVPLNFHVVAMELFPPYGSFIV